MKAEECIEVVEFLFVSHVCSVNFERGRRLRNGIRKSELWEMYKFKNRKYVVFRSNQCLIKEY